MKTTKFNIKSHLTIIAVLTVGIIISLLIIVRLVTASLPIAHLSDAPQKFIDVAYCNSSDAQQTLSIFLPRRDKSSISPLLVFIHGGGWKHGDEAGKISDYYGTKLLNRGVAVASIDYRLTVNNPYPDQNKDVACALSYLHKKRLEYRINTNNSVLFGDSAGAQLAAFAALKIPFAGFDYPAPTGVIDFYGVSDFTKIINIEHPDLFAKRYLGSQYNTNSFSASPTNLITKKAAPFLIIHGKEDKIVPFSQSSELYDVLTSNGVDAELVSVQGAGHGFIGPELPRHEAARVIGAFDEFTKEMYGK